ncbi:TRAP transporter substrate-binding protein DctP [Paracoccus pantotrophus]|uniref:TRAP transporter substrate-binding protein n=1 Tax=Paracoccus pantotrophus TaxID=82367 RepID=UPI00048A48DB|nr:TRAP transporter substrate-binding protein DctP [Paracoccus pantotrophus]
MSSKACAIAVAGMMTATVVQAETLIVTTNLTPSHWASTEGGEPFLACVKERTEGQIDFQYYHSGQLANFFESLNAVNSGLAQVSYIVLAAQSDKLPLTGLSMLPGLGSSVAEVVGATRAALDGEGLIAQEYASNNIVPLMVNVFPAYQMVSRAEPLDSLAAIRGKRISSGGGPLLVTLNALGAVPIESATSDVYLSMQQGTVDGSMLSLASVKPYNLHEVMTSASFNGSFGVATGIWSIDRGVWDGLPAEQQAALRDCGLEVENRLAEWTDNWLADVRTELEGAGVTVFDYSPEELTVIEDHLREARQEYIDRLSARGLPAQEAYDQYILGLSN